MIKLHAGQCDRKFHQHPRQPPLTIIFPVVGFVMPGIAQIIKADDGSSLTISLNLFVLLLICHHSAINTLQLSRANLNFDRFLPPFPPDQRVLPHSRYTCSIRGSEPLLPYCNKSQLLLPVRFSVFTFSFFFSYYFFKIRSSVV